MAEKDWLSKMALKHAERLASAGKYEQAQSILRDVHPDDAVTRTHSQILLNNVKSSLVTQLNERFPDREARPHRAVDTTTLKQEGLRAFDAYVFSLLDGGTSIDDLIALTPASEIETLASLRKLIDLKFVELAN